MYESSQTGEWQLAPSQGRQINEVCDRFEAACKAGQRPRFESFLDGSQSPAQSVLLRELILLDIFYRRQLGETPQSSDYRARFPVLDQQWLTEALSACPAAAAPPQPQRGRFTIERVHAQGGLGQVSVARDEKLRRQVALKEIRADRRDTAARRRFLVEASITGRLEHPGIVPIYTLEEDAEGEPYYVMRYIEGRTLGAAIQAYHQEPTPLVFRELLQRFVSVCQTIAYAHSRGVIHRDLKPANVMLGDYGETLVVDWGLAKEVVRDQGSGVSKEQSSATRGKRTSAADAATASTQPPNDGQTQEGETIGTPAYMSPEQAQGRTAQVGPASDIFSLGAILYTILTGRAPLQGENVSDVLDAAKVGRYLRPRQVKTDVPKALEAICLKAIALVPEDRYASTKDLAGDVEQWLADEPVTAWREPWTVRARRLGRRHKTMVAGLAAALVAGFIITAAALVAVEAAYTREQTAKNNAIAAQLRAEASDRHARQERDVANYERNKTWTALDAMTGQVAADWLATHENLSTEQTRFLTNAITYYDELASQSASDQHGRKRLACSNFRLGSMLSALGKLEEALNAFQRAIAVYDGLAAEFAAVPEYRLDAAKCHNNCGGLLTQLGRHTEAEAALLQAIKLHESLISQFPDIADYRQELGRTYNTLGMQFAKLGQKSRADEAFRAALAIQEKLTADFPQSSEYRAQLSGVLVNLGTLLKNSSQWKAAEQCLSRAIGLQEDLTAAFPSDHRHKQILAWTYNNLGLLLHQARRWSDAENAYRRAVAIQEALCSLFPSVPKYRQDLAGMYGNLAIGLGDIGNAPAAEQAFRQALENFEKLCADFPRVPEYRTNLAGNYINFGRFLGVHEQAEASLHWFGKAIALLTPVLVSEPNLVHERLFLRNAYWNRALVLDKMDRPADAGSDWDQTLTLNSDLADEHTIRRFRAMSLARAGAYREAITEANSLAEMKDVTGGRFYDLARICSLASAAVKDDDKLQDQYAARAVELLRQAVAKGYKDSEHLKKDDDLKPLRRREDFQKLVKEMEEKK